MTDWKVLGTQKHEFTRHWGEEKQSQDEAGDAEDSPLCCLPAGSHTHAHKLPGGGTAGTLREGLETE